MVILIGSLVLGVGAAVIAALLLKGGTFSTEYDDEIPVETYAGGVEAPRGKNPASTAVPSTSATTTTTTTTTTTSSSPSTTSSSLAHHGSSSVLEIIILAIFPYLAYMAADGLRLSGIVAILFCGIAMSRYTVYNLSPRSRETAFAFFKVLASCAETFVFIYMGVAATLIPHPLHQVPSKQNKTKEEISTSAPSQNLIPSSYPPHTFSFSLSAQLIMFLLALALTYATRAGFVWPGVALINRFRPPARHIPPEHRFMLWFSGLRGGVAFALAMSMKHDLGTESSEAVLNITVGIAAVTVLGVGGLCYDMVDRLGLRAPTTPHDRSGPMGVELGASGGAWSGATGPDYDGVTRGTKDSTRKYMGVRTLSLENPKSIHNPPPPPPPPFFCSRT